MVELNSLHPHPLTEDMGHLTEPQPQRLRRGTPQPTGPPRHLTEPLGLSLSRHREDPSGLTVEPRQRHPTVDPGVRRLNSRRLR